MRVEHTPRRVRLERPSSETGGLEQGPGEEPLLLVPPGP